MLEIVLISITYIFRLIIWKLSPWYCAFAYAWIVIHLHTVILGAVFSTCDLEFQTCSSSTLYWLIPDSRRLHLTWILREREIPYCSASAATIQCYNHQNCYDVWDIQRDFSSSSPPSQNRYTTCNCQSSTISCFIIFGLLFWFGF